jgi:menaquinone-dependent protoporphyrinogen oxidase
MQRYRDAMRVLISWGSKMGGTEGIARSVGAVLSDAGHSVTLLPAAKVKDVAQYEAAIIGGALYAFRWHNDAARLVRRNVSALRRMPVWLFSSGPLDDSADKKELAPVTQVGVLAERIGAQAHVTFGGRLPADAKGFPASAMAKTRAGDWRNPERIRGWGLELSRALPRARPRPSREPAGHSVWRVLAHGAVGWGLCAAIGIVLLKANALWLELLTAPLVFVAIAWHYFKKRGAREALPIAFAFTALCLGLNVGLVLVFMLSSKVMLASTAAAWVPPVLVFLTTWATGALCARLIGNTMKPPGGALSAH